MTATPIRAAIIEDDLCEAEGYSVRAYAPVLAMCRKLIEAGFDPAQSLHAYRGDGRTPCLRVSSIGYGARFTVKDGPTGTPRFARWYDSAKGLAAASPTRLAA
jgi:hypothetical protein